MSTPNKFCSTKSIKERLGILLSAYFNADSKNSPDPQEKSPMELFSLIDFKNLS